MSRIIIVEDEPIIAADLAMMLQRNQIEVVHTFDTAEEALPVIRKEQPDLVLLDIELAGKINGIELAKQLAPVQTPYLFITSFSDTEYLAKIRMLNPVAYLVKPVQEHTLLTNIKLALLKGRIRHRSVSPPATKLFVKKESELLALAPSEVLYIEAYDNYAYVQTLSEKYLLTHTLKSVEEKLAGFGFFRVHKSYLINLSCISFVQETFVWIEGFQIPIGKTYKRDLLEALTIL